MKRGPITPRERNAIEALLMTLPIFEAQRASGRALTTLTKIAQYMARSA